MDERLNLLIIPRWYPRDDRPVSGIFVREFAKAVSKYCNVAVLFGHETQSVKGFYEIRHKKDENIETFYVFYRKIGISYISYALAMFLAFLKIKKSFYPDLIHVHVYSAGVLPVILKYIYGIPYVVTEHFKIIKSNRKAERVKLLLAKLVFEKADLLVHVSKFMAYDIERYGIKNKHVIVPNTVDTSLFYYNDSKNVNSTIKHIIFVGNPTSRKGIDYLLQAVHILRQKREDFVLDIVGDGEECPKYKNMAKKLNISDIVVFHGTKSKKEVAEMMRQSSFLVLPSLWENLPCVLIEAIATGLPVIATDVGGVREIIDESIGVIVPPGDTDSLVGAIEFMLDNSDSYDRTKISEYGQKLFSYDAVGRKLYEVYRAVADI